MYEVQIHLKRSEEPGKLNTGQCLSVWECLCHRVRSKGEVPWHRNIHSSADPYKINRPSLRCPLTLASATISISFSVTCNTSNHKTQMYLFKVKPQTLQYIKRAEELLLPWPKLFSKEDLGDSDQTKKPQNHDFRVFHKIISISKRREALRKFNELFEYFSRFLRHIYVTKVQCK